MAEPLVEVGIPTAGRRGYLHEAIESVRAQTFPSWRLVVSVNDIGEPGEDLSRYADDERIEVRHTGGALGPYGNKNALVRAGSARYLALLDDDDRWGPQFLERRVDLLERHPECGFVFSTHVEVDGAGVEVGRGFEAFGPPGVYRPDELMPELLAHISVRRIFTPMLTTLVRRSALEAVGGGFDESLSLVADYELWIRLAARFPVGYLHSWDAYYRWHSAQDSHVRRSGREFLEILDRLDRIVPGDRRALLPPPGELRRQRALWRLSIALDELEAGRRRPAAALLARALRESPGRGLDPRAPAVAAGVALGRPFRPVISRMRARADRRRWSHTRGS